MPAVVPVEVYDAKCSSIYPEAWDSCEGRLLTCEGPAEADFWTQLTRLIIVDPDSKNWTLRTPPALPPNLQVLRVAFPGTLFPFDTRVATALGNEARLHFCRAMAMAYADAPLLIVILDAPQGREQASAVEAESTENVKFVSW